MDDELRDRLLFRLEKALPPELAVGHKFALYQHLAVAQLAVMLWGTRESPEPGATSRLTHEEFVEHLKQVRPHIDWQRPLYTLLMLDDQVPAALQELAVYWKLRTDETFKRFAERTGAPE